MTPSKKTIAVIPVYNHAATLPDVVSAVIKSGFAVLLVDDGSTDDPIKQLTEVSCTIIQFEQNRGKGAAILAGAKKAAQLGYDTIITIDADGQHDPKDMCRLVAEAEQCSSPVMVIGQRQMNQPTVPHSSRFGNHFSNFWIKLECGRDLPDTQSGFRLYPINELLRANLSRKRYDFEIEAIVKLAWAGVQIRSVPVSVHYPKNNERISHFHKFFDNCRLTLLHTLLVIRRILPIPTTSYQSKGPLYSQVKKALHRNPLKTLVSVCREHSSPFWLATAVWLGLFMGALPLIACHTIAILWVAHRLHLNMVAAVAASQFCMPPVVPVICVQVGYFLRNGVFLFDLSWEKWLLEIHLRLFEWFLGSLIFGPALGTAGGILMYRLAKSHQKSKYR